MMQRLHPPQECIIDNHHSQSCQDGKWDGRIIEQPFLYGMVRTDCRRDHNGKGSIQDGTGQAALDGVDGLISIHNGTKIGKLIKVSGKWLIFYIICLVFSHNEVIFAGT